MYTFCIHFDLFTLAKFMELRVYFHHTKSILQQTVTKGEIRTKSILHEVYFLYKRTATKSILFFRKGILLM